MPASSDRVALPVAYWRQWTASAISNLGDGIDFVAVPLLALSLTGDERLLALTTLTAFLPWMLLALPVGVLVDHVDRRWLMVGANVVRAALLAVVAAGALGHWLGIWGLIALLMAVGASEVLFDSSAQAFLPQIVPSDQLARANGLLFTAEIVAGSIAGLAIGALLFDVSVGLPFGVDAATFAIAAVLIVTIGRPAHGPAVTPTADRGGMIDGMRWLRDHALLRSLAAMFTVTNFGLLFGQGIFVKYAVEELGLSSVEFGLLIAISAIGAATGGVIGHRVVDAIGMRAAIVGPYLVFGLGNLVIGVTELAWVVAVAAFVLGAAVTIWNVVTVTLRQQVIPADRFGRVNAVYRWLGAAASTAGIALGGVVAHESTLRMPFLVGGTVAVVAAVLFARPVLRGLGQLAEVH